MGDVSVPAIHCFCTRSYANISSCNKTCSIPHVHPHRVPPVVPLPSPASIRPPVRSAAAVLRSRPRTNTRGTMVSHVQLDGLWRGIMISKGFEKGEFDLVFDVKKATVRAHRPARRLAIARRLWTRGGRATKA